MPVSLSLSNRECSGGGSVRDRPRGRVPWPGTVAAAGPTLPLNLTLPLELTAVPVTETEKRRALADPA
jgi:hypothetical protein